MNRPDAPNVLLVVLESVRAANVPLYGYQRDTTPRLRRFSEEATTYLQARAPSNWTLPSLVSILTGRAAHRHGFTVDDRLRDGATVFERLAAGGRATGVFASNHYLTRHPVGLYDAFETTVGEPEDTPREYDTRPLGGGADGFYYANRFLDWVDGRRGRWAACVTLDDARRHYEPRDAHDRWGDDEAHAVQSGLEDRYWEYDFYGGEEPLWKLGALEQLYDGAIRQADAAFGAIIDGLSDRDALNDTLVVVTSDHGVGLGELPHTLGSPPAVGHAVPMHEANLHVPLVVRAPGQDTVETISQPVSTAGFPEAATGIASPDRGAFVTNDEVLAAKLPPDRPHIERAAEAVDTPRHLFTDARTAYIPTPISTPAVTKYNKWGSSASEQTVHAARAVTATAAADAAFVDALFDDDAAPVGARRDDVDETVGDLLAGL